MGFVGMLYVYICPFARHLIIITRIWSTDNEKPCFGHTHVIQLGVNGAF